MTLQRLASLCYTIDDSAADFVPCIVAFETNVRTYAELVAISDFPIPHDADVFAKECRWVLVFPHITVSRLSTLQSASSLRDLARLLGFKPAKLSYMLYKLEPETKYQTFEIPKRNGGMRTIRAPTKPLKVAQQRLSKLLQDCLDEVNSSRKRKDRIAHGFKRKRSIVSNAKQHRHRRYVFNIDLLDFFPSINFGRVRGYFIHNNQFSLHEKVSTIIAQIACHDNALPQGSPCSPVISNLIAHVMDIHLVRLSSRVGCTYSRYADDLTFSTNKKDFPPEIATASNDEPHSWSPGAELQRLVVGSGFAINRAKTRMQYRTARQTVTGLIVNQKINVPVSTVTPCARWFIDCLRPGHSRHTASPTPLGCRQSKDAQAR